MQRLIDTPDGLELWTESFGATGDPAILLVMGATAQGIVWPDGLCERLAASGYRVVRFDHRDTGRSSKAGHGYDVGALANDAAAVSTALSLAPAHVVGQSAGGMAAQILAVEHPDMVRSLVLLSSSPDANGDIDKPPATGLPGPLRSMREHAHELAANPPRDSAERIEAAVAGWRVLLGPKAEFHERYWRDLVKRTLARASEPDTAGAHLDALDRTPPLTPRIGEIRVPTLVVHGADDPVLPAEHGRALHRAIPGARLVVLAGMGHMFPPLWSPTIADMLVEHFRGAERSFPAPTRRGRVPTAQ